MNRLSKDAPREDISCLVDPLFTWLSGCQVTEKGYEAGGIFDPLDAGVAGEHYATTHFAWCSALRHASRPDPSLLLAARQAAAFHLRTSPDEYSPGNWSYHWDFNNLAFIETYLLLEPVLEPEERVSWQKGFKFWKTNPHWAVNWVAMRARAHFQRYAVLGGVEDRELATGWLTYVLEAQKADGGIEDVKGKSLPSQYHAYTACLLHRMLPEHPSVPWAVRRAARWLLAVTAPDGEMNAIGRGQGQIFGYACAVYLFRAAVALDPESASNYRWAERAVLSRLKQFQTEEGWWPLVLNHLPLKRRAGWYDYHHLSVYNAFAAVWLTMAAAMDVPAGPEEELDLGETWLKDSGLLVVRRKRWFALFGAGRDGDGYRTEPGITPYQLLWHGHDLFRYPLGPGTGKYGALAAGQDQQTHCWAPLWPGQDGKWLAPAGAQGTLAPLPAPNCWRLGMVLNGATWGREVVLGQRFLEARDTLSIEGQSRESDESPLRVQNLALETVSQRKTGLGFVVDPTSGAVLRVWGGSGLSKANVVETAAGQGEVLAAAGRNRTPSGWRLRQGPGDAPGRLPGVVCLSWDYWSGLWKRKQRLMFELARSGGSPKTLFIEPATTITQIGEGLGELLGPSGERHRRCLRGKPVAIGHGLHLASPLLPWPGQRTFPRLSLANRRFWLKQLHAFVNSVQFPQGYVLWLYHPSQLDALDALGHGAELVVYDWTDDWPEALPAHRRDQERDLLEKAQQEMLCRADVVFAVSHGLVERAGQWCPHVHYLPNATDPETFKPADPSGPVHALATRRPLLVYLSQITERLDVGLVRELALRKPEWTLVLAGPVVCPPEFIAPLQGLPNVILAGSLPYEEAAVLAAQADVCLLPHTEDALTRALDPIKLYDYLATGRPIVSTDVAMHQDLLPWVSVASGVKAFAEAVERALSEPPEMGKRRIQAARSHTWSERAKQAVSQLERFFPED
jgi:glycosyltransferase involved in cell wall biosynthesis